MPTIMHGLAREAGLKCSELHRKQFANYRTGHDLRITKVMSIPLLGLPCFLSCEQV